MLSIVRSSPIDEETLTVGQAVESERTRGRSCDRTFENQRYRASGLNLVVAAIVLWNTVYLKRAIEGLREDGHSIHDSLLPHLSPVGWEHIDLTGDYVWHANKRVAKGRFRPLRRPQDSISRLFKANSER